MQGNRALLREIEKTNQPSFIPTDVLRVHKGIALEFNFKARNQHAHDIDSAMNSMHNKFYNLIRNNRNNTTQNIFIGLLNTFLNLRKYLMIKI